jgi:Zn ribbon nucleic-acid-binding protein
VECVECGHVQIHRSIPSRHREDSSLDLPDSASTDLTDG